jgi:hypothetical protein
MQEIEENASHEFLGLTGLLYKVEEGRKNGVLGLSLQVSGDLVNEVRNVMKQKNLSDVMKFVVVLQRKKKKKNSNFGSRFTFCQMENNMETLARGAIQAALQKLPALRIAF